MISGSELGSVIATRVHDPERAGGNAPSRPTSGSSAVDGVTFSPASATVGRLLSVLNGLSDVRPDRVAAAKARVASGQGPSSSAVARQMMSRMVGDRLAAGH